MSSPTKENLQLIASLPTGTKKRSSKRKPTTKDSVTTSPNTSTVEDTTESKPALVEAKMEVLMTRPVETQNVIFRPNPGPQTDFLAASEREVLYGGAAE